MRGVLTAAAASSGTLNAHPKVALGILEGINRPARAAWL